MWTKSEPKWGERVGGESEVRVGLESRIKVWGKIGVRELMTVGR